MDHFCVLQHLCVYESLWCFATSVRLCITGVLQHLRVINHLCALQHLCVYASPWSLQQMCAYESSWCFAPSVCFATSARFAARGRLNRMREQGRGI